MTRNYKTNAEMPWTMWRDQKPPWNTPIWVLCEKCTCDPTLYPGMFKVVMEREVAHRKYRLLDYDAATEDEYLCPNGWDFIAWREMTDHGGTWDKYLQEENNDADR